ncbi:MAG: hypothetical protein FJ308_20490, partial [Planctomycetes bacterium]|nr:hypothetical protein [Planctomycetota bacterium]
MPDYWERLYGFNPNDSSDAVRDQDNDGINNLNEFVNGTDPGDMAAPYLVSAKMVDGELTLRFNEALYPATSTNLSNYGLLPSFPIEWVSLSNNVVTLKLSPQTNSVVALGVTVGNVMDLSGNKSATTNFTISSSFPNLYRTRVVSAGVADAPLYVQIESGPNRWWLTSSSPTSFAAGDDTTQWWNLSNSPTEPSGGGSRDLPKILSTFIERIERVLFREDFESVALRPSKDEDFFGAAGFGASWGPVPPAGWIVDNQGFEAIRITSANPDRDGDGFADLDGVTEWAGWSFARKEFWQASGGQYRIQFGLGRGNVAVADPDEWSDQAHAEGRFNSILRTPEIPLANALGRSVSVKFDSSWRPDMTDGNQTAIITASFDGGPQVEIARWDSMLTGPNYKAEALSETVVLPINNPSGAKTVVLGFQLKDAGNSWWWAIDNLEVKSVFHDVTVVGAKLGEIGVSAFLDRNLDQRRQFREPATVNPLKVGPNREVAERNDVLVIDPEFPVSGGNPLVHLDFESATQAGISDGRWWLVSNSPTQGMSTPAGPEDRWWMVSNSPFKPSSLPPYGQVTNRVSGNPPYVNRPDLAQNQMLGRLEDESFVLNFRELPEHGKVQVSFDLVLMGPVTLGNRFVLQADGLTLDDTGFDNGIMNVQEFPSVAGGTRFASFTGARRVGGDSTAGGYSVYRLGYLVEHTNAALALRFSGRFPHQISMFGFMLQNHVTWGIDNLRVATVAASDGAAGFEVAMIPDATVPVSQPWQHQVGVVWGGVNRSEVRFELSRKPDGMSITSAGVIQWTPSLQQGGSSNQVQVVVSDPAGRRMSRTFAILVNGGQRVVAGKIDYYAGNKNSVAGVRVRIAERPDDGVASGVDGAYSIGVPESGSVTLTPSLTTDVPVANGVTTADITLIRRHVLGITPLDSAYKVMAGDVNGSDTVTTADITLIRRLILGTATNFSTGLWRFVPSDETFSDPTKPWTASRMRR